MSKALCEMTLKELEQELYDCLAASQDEGLDMSQRRHLLRRVEAINFLIQDFKGIE